MKHWGINNLGNGYVNIYSPTIHAGIKDFATKRAVYTELRKLESLLKDAKFKGWISWTELKNIHIMKMFTKLKAYPYGIDIKKETIWFRKEF